MYHTLGNTNYVHQCNYTAQHNVLDSLSCAKRLLKWPLVNWTSLAAYEYWNKGGQY
jgi:hypothetical protein